MAGHDDDFNGEPAAYGDADAGFTLDFLGNVGASLVYNDAPGSSTFHASVGSSSHQNPNEQMGRLDLNGGFTGVYQQYADHIQRSPGRLASRSRSEGRRVSEPQFPAA